jgi:hypothetical protein
MVGDADVHDIVVLATALSDLRTPGNGLNDEFYGLQAPAGRRVVDVAHADEAVAVAFYEFAGARLAGAEGS